MCDLNEYAIFREHVSTFRETCVDQSDGERNALLTQSERKVINFDEVKNEYIKGLHLTEAPCSNDALFDAGNGILAFVEFKNGDIKGEKVYDLRKKIYDSVLIFSDITDLTISDTRTFMDYILVYNREKNPERLDTQPKDHNDNNTTIQESQSYEHFVDFVSDRAKTETIRFGLKKFKDYLFRNVHTYDEVQFEWYLQHL